MIEEGNRACYYLANITIQEVATCSLATFSDLFFSLRESEKKMVGFDRYHKYHTCMVPTSHGTRNTDPPATNTITPTPNPPYLNFSISLNLIICQSTVKLLSSFRSYHDWETSPSYNIRCGSIVIVCTGIYHRGAH